MSQNSISDCTPLQCRGVLRLSISWQVAGNFQADDQEKIRELGENFFMLARKMHSSILRARPDEFCQYHSQWGRL